MTRSACHSGKSWESLFARNTEPNPDTDPVAEIEAAVAETDAGEVTPTEERAEIYARRPVDLGPNAPIYREADFDVLQFLINPAAFYEPVYDDVLRSMLAHVLSVEAR